MRKVISAFALGTAIAALLGTYGHGADMRVPSAQQQAAAYASDPWTGYYIGVNGGYGWNRGAGSGVATDSFGGGFAGSTDFNTAPQGFVGGFHAGYMTRMGNSGFVIGIEGDGDIATLDGTQQNPGFVGNMNSKNRWLASVRGRFGYVFVPNLMAYVTGGYGWGSADFTITGTDGSQVNFSPTLGGGVLGIGTELALTANLLARVEYLHYFFNDISGGMSGNLNNVPVNAVFKAEDNVSLIRGGLTYKF